MSHATGVIVTPAKAGDQFRVRGIEKQARSSYGEVREGTPCKKFLPDSSSFEHESVLWGSIRRMFSRSDVR